MCIAFVASNECDLENTCRDQVVPVLGYRGTVRLVLRLGYGMDVQGIGA
jgi:hypothetical protein